MNAPDATAGAVCATIDPAGHLIAADHRLAELNMRAGGAVGAPLAVPQLAMLVRLAQRLRVLISRGVTVADGEDDLDLWVRAEPHAGGVRLSVTGFRPMAPWSAVASMPGNDDFVRAGADWVWETDAALRMVFVSAEAARFGVEAATVLGRPLTQLFEMQTDAEFPILGAVAARDAFDGQRATLIGSGREVMLEAAPRTDGAGRFAGFVGSAEMLRASIKPLSDGIPEAFSARLDQALRVPLSKIVANADSIHAQSEGPLRDEYTEYAADIATAGRHLMGLVDDLLDLQAVEKPGFSAAREPIDLADVARRAAGLLAVRASALDVRLDKPAPGDMLPVTGEFRRALQVMVNLVGNALRYSPAGGMVWIRSTREGDAAAIIVADQGKGIAVEDQERIFEKFERVDASEPGGSGLGLYIARRLARVMGGDITVDSAPGQGARFIFTLPAD